MSYKKLKLCGFKDFGSIKNVNKAGNPLHHTHTCNVEASLTGDNRVVLDGASHNHDGVVQRTFGLLDELFRSTSHDDGARTRLGTTGEQVEPTRQPVPQVESSNVNIKIPSINLAHHESGL